MEEVDFGDDLALVEILDEAKHLDGFELGIGMNEWLTKSISSLSCNLTNAIVFFRSSSRLSWLMWWNISSEILRMSSESDISNKFILLIS